jgi:DNA polymerase-1
MIKKRLVLLDSHAILHRAYHALPDFASKKGEPTGALYGLVAMLIKIIEDLKPDYIVACYDLPGPTYRHEAYKDYKAQRKSMEDALATQINRSRDIFKAFNVPIYDKPGFEADDMLGTIVETAKKDKTLEIIIASGDMDTMQLVDNEHIKVYTLKKGIKDTIIYDEKAIKERFGFGPELLPDYKGLRGDPSDNIVGIKGIGEKTASTLISNFGTIEEIYKKLDKDKKDEYKSFKKIGITDRIIKLLNEGKEEAEFSKMLATIRRDAPIDFKLPEKDFKDGVDREAVKTLFNELDFRTLGIRFTNVIDGKTNMDNTEVEDEKAVDVEDIVKDIPKDEIEKTSLALWVIDSNRTNPSAEEILEYTKVNDFKKASEIIFKELDKRGLRKVYQDIEMPLIPVINKMEERGVKIDVDLLKDLSKKYHKTLDSLEKKIWELSGVEFNINSPKQLGEVLFDKLQLTAKGLKKTEGGARSTRESELEKLRDAHPVVPLLFEYRELQKLLSTYIDVIPTLVDSNNRLHADFISSGSATGRMASQNPGIQNIPIKTELGKVIRNAFIAEKGFKIVALDYAQIELRIAAFISGDEKLIEIFKQGEDVHKSVASRVFGVPLDKVDSEMRRRAKIINFGILYGMGVNALRQNLGTDRKEAQEFYNNYFATSSGLAKYLDEVKAQAERNGYTETFFGRRRYFEGINSKIPFIKAMAERMAINAPFQGTNADIIKIAMKKVYDFINQNGYEKDVFLVLQVHDELVYEVRESVASKVVPEIKNIMENIIPLKETKGVKLIVAEEMGDNWGELK